MSLKDRLQASLPVTAPLVLNPLMAKMAEAAGFPAGYLGGGATGYQKVALEANLNLTEMCQAALDIRAVSSLPLIFDAAAGGLHGLEEGLLRPGRRLRRQRRAGRLGPRRRGPVEGHRARAAARSRAGD